jgi:hypothetical protein
VAGDNLVHRHSIRTGFTRCGEDVKATEKGEDVGESDPTSARMASNSRPSASI